MLHSPHSKIFVTFLICKWPKNIQILSQPFSLEVLNTLLFHHLFLPSSCQVSVWAATGWSSHTCSASFQEAGSWEKKRQPKLKVWKGKATICLFYFILAFCTSKQYLIDIMKTDIIVRWPQPNTTGYLYLLGNSQNTGLLLFPDLIKYWKN